MEISPIATVRSIFSEKFGIPRQPGLCPTSSAKIEFPKNNFNTEAVKDLDGYSHLWVIFHFHDLKKSPDKAKVRPPRLGGNKSVGVYSSRSPYRPNSIGLSLVEFKGIETGKESINILIANHDLLDGTPVLDIKPFISNDQPQLQPQFGWQNSEWEQLTVTFSREAEAVLLNNEDLRDTIINILENDPRPSYKSGKKEEQIFGMKIDKHEVQFKIKLSCCHVVKITR